MELLKQVVSLSNSKQLKDLGVKQESEFFWQRMRMIGTFINKMEFEREKLNAFEVVSKREVKANAEELYSAFSVAENDNALPEEITFKREIAYFRMNKFKGSFVYYYCDKKGDELFIFTSTNQADAGAMLRIWLIRNKLIEI